MRGNGGAGSGSGFPRPDGKAEEEAIVELSATTATPPAGMRGHASPAGPVAGRSPARVAVIGESVRIVGYGLAGAVLCPAAGREETRAAWASLPPDVEVVVLTADAAGWLSDVLGPQAQFARPGATLAPRPGVLPVVLP